MGINQNKSTKSGSDPWLGSSHFNGPSISVMGDGRGGRGVGTFLSPDQPDTQGLTTKENQVIPLKSVAPVRFFAFSSQCM